MYGKDSKNQETRKNILSVKTSPFFSDTDVSYSKGCLISTIPYTHTHENTPRLF